MKKNRFVSLLLAVVACHVTFGTLPTALAQEIQGSSPSALYPARAGEHTAQRKTSPGDSIDLQAPETRSGAVPPAVVMAPTRSSFLANWNFENGAVGYRLDISTSAKFDSYVRGYQGLDVGNITNRIVSGLNPGTIYYFRVRAYDALGVSRDVKVASVTTPTSPGLVINPTFDASITGDPNAAAIQSMINQAIATYQSMFSDPVTVNILFRYASTDVNGSPFPAGTLARSNFVFYTIAWNTYINALIAAATTANDTAANASLPGSPLSTNILPSSAGGRAIGLNTPPAMFANGTVGAGGTFDGIVTLNSSVPFQFNRPPTSNNFDALRSTEHEMDEVLGLGSFLNIPASTDLRPQDLFSWSSPATRNITSTGTRYFSINSGNTNIVGFNQNSTGDFGDWASDPCPQANPYVQNAFSCKGQFSDVTASSPEGINLDVIGYNLVSSNPGPTALGNISTRLLVETGDNVLIGGFIITGTQPKKIIVRALGPSLPLAGALANPTLELRDSGGVLLAADDDWRTGGQQAQIIATGIPPTNDLESAIVTTLPANNAGYTAIVRGVNNGTGIGVVEAYDLDRTVDSKLGNISTRGFVQTGDNVLIGGLIVLGQSPIRVIVRALGPSLSVPGALGNPTLELRNSSGTLIGANDDWRTGGQEADIIATGIPPNNDLESALIAILPANNAGFTAIVRGVNNTTGIAVVEAYELH